MSAPASPTVTGSSPAVGDPAPDFTADSTAGSPVSLSSFRGKKRVLIAFFPLAFTSTCTAELCDLSDDFDQFTYRWTGSSYWRAYAADGGWVQWPAP